MDTRVTSPTRGPHGNGGENVAYKHGGERSNGTQRTISQNLLIKIL